MLALGVNTFLGAEFEIYQKTMKADFRSNLDLL